MGGGAASSAIPASDRKLITRLKEIVSNNEDEIYAMLKECNRDPDETVQRLLNEGKFLVVKRKREKKKEPTSNKDSSDSRSAFSSGSSIRGGRSSGVLGRGVGRGSSLPRASTTESNGGRSSKASAVRENGTATIPKVSSSGSGILSYSQLVQPKTPLNDYQHLPPPLPNVSGELGHLAQFSALQGSWPAGLGTAAPASLQGAWLAGAGRGQGTIADMLRSSGMRTTVPSVPTVQCDNDFQQPVLTSMISSRGASSPYMDGLSAVPIEPVESSTEGLMSMSQPGVQYSNGDESFLLHDQNDDRLSSVPLGGQFAVEQLDSYLEQSGHTSELIQSSSISVDSSLHGYPSAYPVHYYPESQEDPEDGEQVEDDASSVEATDTPSDGVLSTGVSPSVMPSYSDSVSAAAAKLQELHVRDEQSVIIPDHLRVSDADCTKLSFGSFESGIGALSSNFASESKSASFTFGDAMVNDSMAGASEPVAVSTSTNSGVEHHADLPDTMDNIATTGGTTIDNSMGAKPEETTQLRTQDPYLGVTPPSFPAVNLVTQEQESHYVAEHSGSRAQDISRLSNVLPYPDLPAAGNYYGGVFRPSPDADAQYSAFLPSSATGKFGAIRPSGHEQSPVAPEVANNLVFPSPSTMAHTLPSVNIPSVQQQSLPMHAYATQPSAVHLGPYANVLGYQYMPPGFNYLQSHYQQNFGNALKYSMPQYKQSASMNVGMHNTVTPGASGYGGYANSQPGYTLSPPVTTGNSPNFDDVPVQYKDTSLYIPAQQVEGSSNWLQAPLSRDVPGGSFYNVHGQNQQARYSQAQSLNAHSLPGAVYNNLYRPQQSGSGSTPNAHQLLQQHQALGSVSGLGSQIGSYQQAQRGQQQSWANGF